MKEYDVIVIGAGIAGSYTAYTLAKQGYTVLLLEQFALPHSRGSSHGQSRVIRKAYTQQCYARMMPEAYRLWLQLEQEAGTQLYRKTGILEVSRPPSQAMSLTASALDDIGAAYQRLSSQQLSHNYPMLKFATDYQAILDPDGGLLRSDRCLKVIQDIFQKHGGNLRDAEPVVAIAPGTVAMVTTSKGVYGARKLVLTAGAWMKKILQQNLGINLPLQPVRTRVYYWKEKTAGQYSAHTGFPTFADYFNDLRCGVYGCPALEYPGHMKLNWVDDSHHIDPDYPDARLDVVSNNLEQLRPYVREHFPGLHDIPSIQENCMVTFTPDGDYVLDRHPEWPNIIIGCCAAHGFKLAPVIGKLLAELVTCQTPSYDMTPFALNRFTNTMAKL